MNATLDQGGGGYCLIHARTAWSAVPLARVALVEERGKRSSLSEVLIKSCDLISRLNKSCDLFSEDGGS